MILITTNEKNYITVASVALFSKCTALNILQLSTLMYKQVYTVDSCALHFKCDWYLEIEVHMTSYKYFIVNTTSVDQRWKANHQPIPWLSSMDQIQIGRALPSSGKHTKIHHYCPQSTKQN